jgi:hypothetical protein
MYHVLTTYCLIPVVDLTRIVEWVKNAAVDLIKWAALRVLLIGLISTLVPLAIYAAWLMISEQILAFVTTQTSAEGWSGAVVEFTGIAAWIGTRLQLVQCFQVLATFLSLKFALGFVKK